MLTTREKKRMLFWKFKENKRNKNGARSYRRIYRKQDSSRKLRKLRKFIYKGKVFFKTFPPILINFKIFPVRSYAHAGRFYISDEITEYLQFKIVTTELCLMLCSSIHCYSMA